MRSSSESRSSNTPLSPTQRHLLRAQRQRLLLSQAQLAASAGTFRTLISKLESGNQSNSDRLPDILNALGIDPASFDEQQSGNTLGSLKILTLGTMEPIRAKEPEGVKYIVLKVLKSAGGYRSDKPDCVQMPAMLLPAGARHQAAAYGVAEVPGEGFVIVDTRCPLQDGGSYLLLWRDTFVAATVSFTARGYRLGRAAANDELSEHEFEQQIAVVGRITGTFHTHTL